jgi:hypothetical protein
MSGWRAFAVWLAVCMAVHVARAQEGICGLPRNETLIAETV